MYEVVLPDRIEKKLPRTLGDAYGRVIRALRNLAEEPRPTGCIRMSGEENLWRIRVGNYRIIYTIDDERRVIEVLIGRPPAGELPLRRA